MSDRCNCTGGYSTYSGHAISCPANQGVTRPLAREHETAPDPLYEPLPWPYGTFYGSSYPKTEGEGVDLQEAA